MRRSRSLAMMLATRGGPSIGLATLIACTGLATSAELEVPEAEAGAGPNEPVIPYGEGAGHDELVVPETDHDPGPVRRISMRGTACFGTCPMYEVSLDDEGTITWDGEMFVQTVGRARAQGPAGEVAAFFERLRQIDLDAIPTEYGRDADCGELWTDHPSTIIVVYRADRSTKITDYHGCRGNAALDALRPLEGEFERLVGVERWIGRHPKCVAYPAGGAWYFLTNPQGVGPSPLPDIVSTLARDPSSRLLIHAHASRRDAEGASRGRGERMLTWFIGQGIDSSRVELQDHGTDLADADAEADDVWTDEGLNFEMVSEDCLRGDRDGFGAPPKTPSTEGT